MHETWHSNNERMNNVPKYQGFVMLCSLKTFKIRKFKDGLFEIVSATLLGCLSLNAHKEIVIVLENVDKKKERACL